MNIGATTLQRVASVRLASYSLLAQGVSLVCIILIAGLLRFYKLGEWSFWGDEIYTLRTMYAMAETPWVQQPISILLTRAAINLLGISEWSARLVPALVGMISIPVLYFPIRKLFGPAVGLAASLLLAVSPWHLYWSQNARFYVTLLLFYTLGLFAFYLGLEEDRPVYLLLALTALGIATYERLFALMFVPVVIAYPILLYLLPLAKPRGLRWRNMALFFLPGIWAALWLAIPFVQQPERWLGLFGRVNNNPLWILAGVVYYVRLPILCLGVLGILYLLAQKERVGLLLGLAATVPILVMMGIALIQYSANRYAFVTVTMWVVLASVAGVALIGRTQGLGRLLATGVLLVLLLDPISENILYYRYQQGNRANWKAAFEWVRQHKGSDEPLYVVEPLVADYYLREPTLAFDNLEPARIEADQSRVWFIEDLVVAEAYPQHHNWLVAQTQLMAVFDVNVHARTHTMRIYVYEPARMRTPISSK